MDGRTAFVMQTATQLIAAGGAYKNKKLEEVIDEVMFHLFHLDEHFNPPCTCGGDDEEPTLQ